MNNYNVCRRAGACSINISGSPYWPLLVLASLHYESWWLCELKIFFSDCLCESSSLIARSVSCFLFLWCLFQNTPSTPTGTLTDNWPLFLSLWRSHKSQVFTLLSWRLEYSHLSVRCNTAYYSWPNMDFSMRFRCFRKMGRDSTVLTLGRSLFHHWGARTKKCFVWAERELPSHKGGRTKRAVVSDRSAQVGL
jgi:hypothetical protein